MNNELENKEIAQNIVDRLVKSVEHSVMLQNYVNAGIDDAIKKTVKFNARDIVRIECSSDEVDGDGLAKTLGISCSNFEEWESRVIAKISERACEELRKRIQVPTISESVIPEHVGKPKYEVLLG